jgi:hypothetical protein
MEKLCDTDLTARRREGACAIAFSPDIQLLQTSLNLDFPYLALYLIKN